MPALLIELFRFIGVLSGAEAHKTVIINVDFERIEACNKHKESQIVLVAIDEVWVIDVVAHNVRFQNLLIRDFSLTLENTNSFGISTIDGFAYPEAVWIQLSLHLELFVVFSAS